MPPDVRGKKIRPGDVVPIVGVPGLPDLAA